MKNSIIKICTLLFVITILVILIVVSDSIVLNIILCGFGIVFFNSLVQILFQNCKNKTIILIKRSIDNISGFILLGFIYLKSYILGFAIIAFTFIILTSLIALVNKYIIGNIINDRSTIYFSAVLTLIFTSYKSGKLLGIYIRFMGDTKGVISGYSNYKGIDYFTKLNIRKLCYEISIILYIITRMINLSEIDFISEGTSQLISALAAEVFLTFVAIDSYVSIFKNDVIKKNNLECEKIKKIYLEKFNIEADKYKFESDM